MRTKREREQVIQRMQAPSPIEVALHCEQALSAARELSVSPTTEPLVFDLEGIDHVGLSEQGSMELLDLLT